MLKIDEKNFRKIRKWAFLMNSVPFLRGCFVCNSYAMGTQNELSDIDLFVVTKVGRLYTARAFMNLFFRLFRIRTYGSKISGRFCLSFFADEKNLNLLPISVKKDFYLAYWIHTLRPVIDNGVSNLVENRNSWVKDLIGLEVKLDKSFVWRDGGFLKKFFEIMLFAFPESIFRYFQIKKIKKRGKDVLVKNGILKLHENDRRIALRDEYGKEYGEKFEERNFISLLQHSHGK